MNVTEQKKAIKSHCQRTSEIKYTARKNVSYCGYKNLIKVKGGFAANE